MTSSQQDLCLLQAMPLVKFYITAPNDGASNARMPKIVAHGGFGAQRSWTGFFLLKDFVDLLLNYVLVPEKSASASRAHYQQQTKKPVHAINNQWNRRYVSRLAGEYIAPDPVKPPSASLA